MNSYLAPELANAMHRDMIRRGAYHRTVAAARRQQKARRLTRKAAALAERAAQLVEQTHR
jgi:hypothetical protein